MVVLLGVVIFFALVFECTIFSSIIDDGVRDGLSNTLAFVIMEFILFAGIAAFFVSSHSLRALEDFVIVDSPIQGDISYSFYGEGAPLPTGKTAKASVYYFTIDRGGNMSTFKAASDDVEVVVQSSGDTALVQHAKQHGKTYKFFYADPIILDADDEITYTLLRLLD